MIFWTPTYPFPFKITFFLYIVTTCQFFLFIISYHSCIKGRCILHNDVTFINNHIKFPFTKSCTSFYLYSIQSCFHVFRVFFLSVCECGSLSSVQRDKMKEMFWMLRHKKKRRSDNKMLLYPLPLFVCMWMNVCMQQTDVETRSKISKGLNSRHTQKNI